MKCTDQDIAKLLPWYVNGTLSRKEQEHVRSHLDDCPKCRREIEAMRWLSTRLAENSEALFSEHILPEMLVIYAENKSELSSQNVLEIEKHLETCADCQKEMQILEKVNQSFRATNGKTLFEKLKTRLSELFPKALVSPALAYVIILILLYPAWLGVFKLRNEIQRMREPGIASSPYELKSSDTRAGIENQNEIILPSQPDVITLCFNIPILVREDIRYDALILDNDKKIIWERKDIKSMDEYGTFLLICHSRFFTHGTYMLKVKEVSLTDNQVRAEFNFSLYIKEE